MSSYFNLMVTKQPIVSDRENGMDDTASKPPTIRCNKLHKSIPPQSDPVISDPSS